MIRLERTRFGPGTVARSLALWTATARTPRSRNVLWLHCGCGGFPECCFLPGMARDMLENVVWAMPRKSARELRQILRDLDDAITGHPRFIQTSLHDGRWWTATPKW